MSQVAQWRASLNRRGSRLALDPQLDVPLPVAERRLERVHDPLALPVLDRDAVEHDL